MKYIPGDIINGDWDKAAENIDSYFEKYVKYQGLVEHFTKGIPWEETVLFREYYFKELDEKGSYKGFTTREAIISRYGHTFDLLYESIKKEGIIPRSLRRLSITPIYVHIGRNGEFIFTSGGNHRLSIAKILGIERIPVRVWIRHAQWQAIRDDLDTALSEADNATRAFLRRHPDLQDIGKRVNNFIYYYFLINYSHLLDEGGFV